MKTFFTATFCVPLFSLNLVSLAQSPPEIAWEKNYGGSLWEQAAALISTDEGGFAFAVESGSADGDITETPDGSSDVWFVKLDAEHNIEWQKMYGGSGTESPKQIIQTNDGGYIILAQTNSAMTNWHFSTDYWIIKTDADGNIEWDKCYGSNGGDYPRAIIEDGEGNYILAGSSFSNGGDVHGHIGGSDAWLIKIDATGNILWEYSYGGSDLESANAICAASDGGFIVAAGANSNNFDVTGHHGTVTTSDYWIFKISTDGILQWQVSLGGAKNDTPYSIRNVSDGGYIINGESNSNDGDVTGHHGLTTRNDIWVVKINEAGTLQWQKSMGGTAYDAGTDAIESSPGKYLICGGVTSADGDITDHYGAALSADAWVAELDDTGSLLWSGSYGGTLSDGSGQICQLNYGNTIISGYAESTDGDVSENNGGRDIWLFELQTACTTDNSLTLTGDQEFCKGSNIILSAVEDESYTYQWKKNGTDISGATENAYTAVKTGTYQVYITSGDCSVLSEEIEIIVHPKPKATISNPDITNDLCTDSSIKLKANSGSGLTYQWYDGATAISGATANIYFATTPGNYKVKIMNSYGCEKLSAAYSIISSCKKVNTLTENIVLCPNPNTGIFNLSLPSLYKEETCIVSMKNTAGDVVYASTLTAGNNAIDVSPLPSGIYFITVQSLTGVCIQQFVKTE